MAAGIYPQNTFYANKNSNESITGAPDPVFEGRKHSVVSCHIETKGHYCLENGLYVIFHIRMDNNRDRIKQLLAPLRSILDTKIFAVYDRHCIIRYANDAFIQETGYPEHRVVGRPITYFITQSIGARVQDVRNALLLRERFAQWGEYYIFKSNPHMRDSRIYAPPEECGGAPSTLHLSRLGTDFFLAFILSRSSRIYPRMGMLSSDILVTIDAKDRILAFNENFQWMVNIRPEQLFGTKVEQFFVGSALKEARRAEVKACRDLARRTMANPFPWTKICSGSFPGARFQEQWVADTHCQIVPKSNGAVITSPMDCTFVAWKKPFDHTKTHLRWAAECQFRRETSFGIFFNGSWASADSSIVTPDITGYYIGVLMDWEHRNRLIFKRWGKTLIEIPLFFNQAKRRIRLAVENAEGAFRVYIDSKMVLEYADPRFLHYGLGTHSGLLFSGFPAKVYKVSIWQRDCQPLAQRPQRITGDFIFRNHPDHIFAAEFFQRQVKKTPITDLYLRRVTELRKEQKVKEQELQVASSVLERLLPRKLPSIPGVIFKSYYAPCGFVGGDLYDAFRINDTQTAILMYDVSGHGVPAALVSVMMKTLFLKHFQPGRGLKEQLGLINKELRLMIGKTDDAFENPFFVTVFFGIIDHVRHTLRYIGTGAPAPLIVAQKGITALQTVGYPLGLMETLNSHEYTIDVRPPLKLLLFTDGLIEIFNRDGSLYDKNKMVALITRHRRKSLHQLIEAILKEHRGFTGNAPPRDDVSLLGIEFE